MNWLLTIVFGEKCPRQRCGRRLHAVSMAFHNRAHWELDQTREFQRRLREAADKPGTFRWP